MAKEMKIIINDGGMIDTIAVSKDLKDIDVEIIDLCTDQPDELKETKREEKAIRKAIKKEEMFEIY